MAHAPPPTPSPALQALTELAVSHGINSISSGGPLIPFAIVERGDARDVQRFVVGDGDQIDLQASVDAGKAFCRSLAGKADRAVLAVDGFITVDGAKRDALIFDAFETGASGTWQIAQMYGKKFLLRGCKAQGGPALVGMAAPLW